MSYNINNFLIRASDSDTLLHLRDSNGNVKWTINAFDIVSSFISANLLKINTKTQYITLDFGNSRLAQLALTNLQVEIKKLRDIVPIRIDAEIENYVSDYVNRILNKTEEVIIGGSGSTVRYNYSEGRIWSQSDLVSNYVANFIGFNIRNRASTATIFITQGPTASIISDIQLDGATVSVNWANNAMPTGTANNIDIIGFTFLNIGGTVSVLAQMNTYGIIP